MSVYLYGFQPKGNKTRVHSSAGEIEIFNLTFRTGNLGSYSTKLENAWSGKTLPEFFVIGKREEGDTVYQVQKPLCHAEWVDTNPLPGKAEPIGYLKKMGGRFMVILETKKERLERTKREAAEEQALTTGV